MENILFPFGESHESIFWQTDEQKETELKL